MVLMQASKLMSHLPPCSRWSAASVRVFYLAEDVQDAVLRAGARGALRISELPDAIAMSDYNVTEVWQGCTVVDSMSPQGGLAATTYVHTAGRSMQ